MNEMDVIFVGDRAYHITRVMHDHSVVLVVKDHNCV